MIKISFNILKDFYFELLKIYKKIKFYLFIFVKFIKNVIILKYLYINLR